MIPWTAARQASLSFTISRACSDSCPLSQWCHPTILSSVVLSSYLQSFPASWSFLMSLLFSLGGCSIGASVSVLHWILRIDFLYDWLVWSCCPGESQESSSIRDLETLFLKTLICTIMFTVFLHVVWLMLESIPWKQASREIGQNIGTSRKYRWDWLHGPFQWCHLWRIVLKVRKQTGQKLFKY